MIVKTKEFRPNDTLTYLRTGLILAIAFTVMSCKSPSPPEASSVATRSASANVTPKLPYGSDMKIAIKAGQLATVKMLLNAGVDVNSKDEEGNTPLGEACNARKTAVIRLLLDAGANPNAVGFDGWYPIDLVATSTTTEPVELLLSKGANVNSVAPDGETPLLKALDGGSNAVASLLVTHGADVNAHNARSRAPLFFAARTDDANNHPTIAQLLIEHGAVLPSDECSFTIELLHQHSDGKAADEVAEQSACKQ